MVDHRGSESGTTLGQEATIHAALDAVEAAFPGSLRAAYVEGSRADGSAVPTSDLDLTVVFVGAFRDGAARRAAEDCLRRVRTGSGADLDVTVMDEVELAGGAPPMLKLAGRLVYGADVVAAASLMPIAAWTRERMHVASWLLMQVFGRPPAVRLPIGYPDPGDEFSGYARRAVTLADGATVPSTRDLVRVTGWMATALVALEAGRYVPRKRDCHLMYRAWVGDAWSSLLDDIHGQCRGEWAYLVPEGAEARERLRAIGARTRAFENAFLGRYRAFLLAELRGAEGADLRHALWVQSQIPYRHPEVLAAVAAHAETDDISLGAAVADALGRLRDADG